MTKLEIASTIVEQIKCADRMALMAWGASQMIALGEHMINDRAQVGGLQMNVRGLKFVGKVLIRLMGNDTYTVEIGRVRKAQWISKGIIEDVHCEELMSTIDGLIER